MFDRGRPTLPVAVAILAVVAGLSIVVFHVLQPSLLTDVERLAAIPESHLEYPGSIPLYNGGHETTQESPAERWELWGTSATREEVLAFYVSELPARGYVDGGPFGPTTEETMACSWSREVSVRLAFSDPTSIRRRFKIDPNYTTVYDLRVIDTTGRPHTRPCSSLTECVLGGTPLARHEASPRIRCRILE